MRYINPTFIVEKKVKTSRSRIFGLRSFSSLTNLYDLIASTLDMCGCDGTYSFTKKDKDFYLPSTLFKDQGFDLYRAVYTVILDGGETPTTHLEPYNLDYLKRLYLSKKVAKTRKTNVLSNLFNATFGSNSRSNNAILAKQLILNIASELVTCSDSEVPFSRSTSSLYGGSFIKDVRGGSFVVDDIDGF